MLNQKIFIRVRILPYILSIIFSLLISWIIIGIWVLFTGSVFNYYSLIPFTSNWTGLLSLVGIPVFWISWFSGTLVYLLYDCRK